MMSICDMDTGCTGVVTAVRAEGPIRRRLLDLGLIRNSRITVSRTAPLGGPIWIRLSGCTQIALRRTEAALIQVEALVPETTPSSEEPS